MVELYCDGHYVVTPWGEDFNYVVTDKDNVVVARGISSNESWAEHDAGGYHTKWFFNDIYGVGNWHVNFAWKKELKPANNEVKKWIG